MFWEEMEWPEGSRVEIIEGIVTVSPAPAYGHNLIAARIQRDPEGDVYRPLLTAKFGEPLKLPAPFGLVIDTAEFPAP
ncbi:hypothetical protein [Streptomyces sp. NPDC055058]